MRSVPTAKEPTRRGGGRLDGLGQLPCDCWSPGSQHCGGPSPIEGSERLEGMRMSCGQLMAPFRMDQETISCQFFDPKLRNTGISISCCHNHRSWGGGSR